MSLPLIDSFDVVTNKPIETSMQVSNIAARNAIDNFKRWEGMQVYCIEENKGYILSGGLTNSNWVQIFPSINTIKSGQGITVDDTDPLNLIVTLGGTGDSNINGEAILNSSTFNDPIMSIFDDGFETGVSIKSKASFLPNQVGTLFMDSGGIGFERTEISPYKIYQLKCFEEGVMLYYSDGVKVVRIGIDNNGKPYLEIDGNVGTSGQFLGSDGNGGITWITP